MSADQKTNNDLDILLSRHFERWSLTAPLNHRLVRNQNEFNSTADIFEQRVLYQRQLEAAWESQLLEHEFIGIPGLCRVCKRATSFRVDLLYGYGNRPNWRERVVCEHCGLNNRLRMCADAFEGLNARKNDGDVYITEQVTSMFTLLNTRCRLTGSEYFGPQILPGKIVNGLRHEDSTGLSFPDSSFDAVLSFDVLEHIPDAQKALQEIARVLRPGGTLLLTAPFDVSASKNLQRARVEKSGEITHIEPPDYHGDPVNPEQGILCYWWFGWELLNDLHTAGFTDAAVSLSWSAESGYLGPASPLIVAQR